MKFFCGSHAARMFVTPVLDGTISLKFSMETRLESGSFESLIDFLAFLVQKLWPNLK